VRTRAVISPRLRRGEAVASSRMLAGRITHEAVLANTQDARRVLQDGLHRQDRMESATPKGLSKQHHVPGVQAAHGYRQQRVHTMKINAWHDDGDDGVTGWQPVGEPLINR
jgi:hypothetical protein